MGGKVSKGNSSQREGTRTPMATGRCRAWSRTGRQSQASRTYFGWRRSRREQERGKHNPSLKAGRHQRWSTKLGPSDLMPQASNFQPIRRKNFSNVQHLTIQSGALTSPPSDCQIKSDNSPHNYSHPMWTNQNYTYFFVSFAKKYIVCCVAEV